MKNHSQECGGRNTATCPGAMPLNFFKKVLTFDIYCDIISIKKEGIKMKKEIWFDMDGTIANLYGVENWLNDLINENTRPYAIAKPLMNMQVLARTLNKLTQNGFTVNIISWTSKNGTDEYNQEVAKVKKEWLNKHLKSVHFKNIDIVPYGTPKQIGRKGILFDDEIQNRENWEDIAFDVNNIIEILKNL